MAGIYDSIQTLSQVHSELVTAVKSFPGSVATATNDALRTGTAGQNDATQRVADLRNQIENDGQSLILDWEHDVAVVNGEGKPINEVVTFSRSTGGGRFGPDGKYEWVEAGVPRIDYDPETGECLGLLVEEQRTNLIPNSQPDSGFTGPGVFEIVPNWFCGRPGVLYEGTSYMTNSSSWRTTTQEGGTYFVSYFSDFDGSPAIHTGSGSYLPATYKEQVAPGLWRYGRQFVATGVQPIIHIRPGEGAIAGGVQVEEGTFPTSYIPTEGAAVTRAADLATMVNASDWTNPTEGAFLVNFKTDVPTTVVAGVSLMRTSGAGVIVFTPRNSGAAGYYTVSSGGDAGTFRPALDVNTNIAIAIAYRVGQLSRFTAGGIKIGNSSGSPLTTALNTQTVEIGRGSPHYLNGTIKRLEYFPRALSDTELQELTTI